ncbi:MAG: TldD/PmbA family protein [Thermoplasmata archaeon]|nr:TldD/PmbA family protein [Thermoplasmata archaeon]
MSAPGSSADTAFRVAERLRGKVEAPWEVFGERLRRYEVHLNGGSVEMARGPIELEGFGLRVLRPVPSGLGVGFVATTGLGDEEVDRVRKAAEEFAPFGHSPAKAVVLPGSGGPGPASVESVDRALWERPEETLAEYVHALLEATGGRPEVVPSFGSVRVTLGEATLANSSGLERAYTQTLTDVEVAVKAFGGPEGAPPGEYWVNRRSRQLDPRGLREEAAEWAQRAQDARRAKAPPTGPQRILFPTDVMTDVMPSILGFRFSGAAELRHMTPKADSKVAADSVHLWDDGQFPFGLGTAPVDDEGTPSGRTRLVKSGEMGAVMLDLIHASATGRPDSTGNGRRDSIDFAPWFHFTRAPAPVTTTIVLEPGKGGTDEEMIEAAGDGIWLGQLGYAFPDDISAAFGGEIRIGYRIRHGKLAEPIRGGTLGGVLIAAPGDPSILGSVSNLGSRSVLSGHLSAPTMQVENVTVAGDT